MAIELKLPDLGENIEGGDVVGVLVQVGDTIVEEQAVLEVETDKATVEIPSSVSGTVTAIHINVGDEIKVGQLILVVEGGNGQGESPSDAVASAEPEPSPEPEPVTEVQPKTEPTPTLAAEPAASGPIEVRVPAMGENVGSGDLVGILVKVGDTIAIDDPIIEVETDKATVEIPSSANGVVTAIHVEVGDEIVFDQLIITVKGQAEAAPAPTPAPPAPAEPTPAPAAPQPEPVASPPPPPAPVEPPKPAGPRKIVPAAPSIRRLARELGVDIQEVPGTGPAGRISMKDVKNYVKQINLARKAAPPPVVTAATPELPPLPDFSKWGDIERQRMTGIRRATARQMDLAWRTVPHVTHFDKVDITDLERLRKQFGKRAEAAGGKLTITAILLKVVALALKRFPEFNASLDIQNQEIVYKKYYHIGMAVDTDRGLLVPSIRDVDQKSIIELSAELNEKAAKARDRKLTLDEMQGSTFTITNLGGIGGTNFTPIVNYPEVAILGVARGRQEAVYKDGQFVPRMLMPIGLSYDHRIIDGANAARFVRWVREALEEPFLLMLEG